MPVAGLSSLRGAQLALRNADWNIDTTNRADTLSLRSLCAKRARSFFSISAVLKNADQYDNVPQKAQPHFFVRIQFAPNSSQEEGLNRTCGWAP